MLTSTCAIFPCKDMNKTVAFYTEIGFKLTGRWDDYGYLTFERDAVELHFSHNPNFEPSSQVHAAYIRSDDVDAWSDEIAKLGLTMEGYPSFCPAADQSWGMREFTLLDPDKHLLRVGQFIDG